MTSRGISSGSVVRRLLVSAALALLPAASPMACQLRVQMPTIESFTRPGADGELEGCAVDVMREALRRIGCVPRFVDLPGPRSWDALQAG